MKARIEVRKRSGGTFEVHVAEGGGASAHRVTVKAEDYQRLAGESGATMEELVRLSFEFLLEREPKESILAQFDLREIGRYFPQYEGEIRKRLSKS